LGATPGVDRPMIRLDQFRRPTIRVGSTRLSNSQA
jgi:ribosome maturation factor RimP